MPPSTPIQVLSLAEQRMLQWAKDEYTNLGKVLQMQPGRKSRLATAQMTIMAGVYRRDLAMCKHGLTKFQKHALALFAKPDALCLTLVCESQAARCTGSYATARPTASRARSSRRITTSARSLWANWSRSAGSAPRRASESAASAGVAGRWDVLTGRLLIWGNHRSHHYKKTKQTKWRRRPRRRRAPVQ